MAIELEEYLLVENEKQRKELLEQAQIMARDMQRAAERVREINRLRHELDNITAAYDRDVPDKWADMRTVRLAKEEAEQLRMHHASAHGHCHMNLKVESEARLQAEMGPPKPPKEVAKALDEWLAAVFKWMKDDDAPSTST